MSLSKYKASTCALAEIKNEDSKYYLPKICDCRVVLQAEREETKSAKSAEGATAGPDAGAVPSEEKGQSVEDNTSSAAITTATLAAITPLLEVAGIEYTQKKEASSPPLSTAPSSETEQLELERELLAVESLTKQLQDGDGMDLTEKGFWIRAKIAAELFDDGAATRAATTGSTDDNNKETGAHTGPGANNPGGDSAAAGDDDDDDDDSWSP